MSDLSGQDRFEQRQEELAKARRTQSILFSVAFVLLFAVSCEAGEASLPVFIEGLPNLASYFSDLTPMIRMNHIGEDVAEWYWGIGKWLKLLWDTILMAFLGTFLGTIMAFLLCFPASANLMPLKPVYFITRRITEFARAVPELVYAMIFVFSFGIGPFPGILAIAIHTAGALGKLFSEVNENLDEKAIEGVRASGGNWFEVIRFAVVPQVLPNFTSYTLLRFEINVRAASVIGFVGAGVIGQELMFVIRQFVYTDISAIVLMIILTVIAIDLTCESLRHRLIGKEAL